MLLENTYYNVCNVSPEYVQWILAVFAAVRHVEMVDMVTIVTTVNLVSQYQHELSGNEEEGDPPVDDAFIGGINPLTTISLSLEEAWRNATANDHDLHLAMEVVRLG